MAATVDFSAGRYRFLPGVFQYSGGVAALSGHAIERVRFRTLLPLKQGFERIERLIGAAGRPLTAFCACELRSPAPFTEQGARFAGYALRRIFRLDRRIDAGTAPVCHGGPQHPQVSRCPLWPWRRR